MPILNKSVKYLGKLFAAVASVPTFIVSMAAFPFLTLHTVIKSLNLFISGLQSFSLGLINIPITSATTAKKNVLSMRPGLVDENINLIFSGVGKMGFSILSTYLSPITGLQQTLAFAYKNAVGVYSRISAATDFDAQSHEGDKPNNSSSNALDATGLDADALASPSRVNEIVGNACRSGAMQFSKQNALSASASSEFPPTNNTRSNISNIKNVRRDEGFHRTSFNM